MARVLLHTLVFAPDGGLLYTEFGDGGPNGSLKRIDWETGDVAATEEVFADADVVVRQDMVYPRVHPAPMETCGTIASMDPVTGKLTVWSTNQAPHAHRTIYALVALGLLLPAIGARSCLDRLILFPSLSALRLLLRLPKNLTWPWHHLMPPTSSLQAS